MPQYGLSQEELKDWQTNLEYNPTHQKIDDYIKTILADNAKYEEAFSLLKPWMKLVKGAMGEMQADFDRALELRGEILDD